MSVTIYYTAEEKSESVMSEIERVNADPDWEWEFVPVDQEFGIQNDEYLVHLDDKKVLVTRRDDPPWPAKPSDAPKRASLSGWKHMNRIRNVDDGDDVIGAIDVATWFG